MNIFASSTEEQAQSCATFSELATSCSQCEACGLRGQPQVSQVVVGDGSPTADIMFVGEAPGANEDKDGIPFCGRSGQLLRTVIAAMSLSMDDVYICNVVKCRPPENRDPLPEEVEACAPWLDRQIELVQPKVIIGLGKFAAFHLLSAAVETVTSINRFSLSKYRGQLHGGSPLIMPTWHPAYLLRNPSKKQEFWDDMLLVCKEISVTPVNQQ